MTLLKLKLLAHSLFLYFLGIKISHYKTKLSDMEKMYDLNSRKLSKISNQYQALLKKWIFREKQILFLRGFIRMKQNHNL